MSTFKFRASIIGFAVLTLAIFVASYVMSHHAFPTPPWPAWGGLTLAALVLGLTVTAALDKPLDRK